MLLPPLGVEKETGTGREGARGMEGERERKLCYIVACNWPDFLLELLAYERKWEDVAEKIGEG